MGVVIFNISAVSSKCSPTSDSQGIHMMVPATRDNMGSIEDLITSSIPAGDESMEAVHGILKLLLLLLKPYYICW